MFQKKFQPKNPKVFFEGFYGDCSAMALIGDVDDTGKKLCQTTKECVYKAVDAVKPGLPLEVIAETITKHAGENGFVVIPDFCGHFIGRV